MREEVALNVSALPTWGFAAKSLPWWGTVAFMALEGMGFALAAGAYLYLYAVNGRWPMSAPPDLGAGSLQTAVLLLSVIPNVAASHAARAMDLHRTRRMLIVMTLVAILSLGVRVYEFANVSVFWDSNAYGSAVWFILGLHTTHVATDLVDTVVLAALMFTRHAQPRRFSDVTDNAFYWNFVVVAWLPLYALLYWMPRW